MTRATTLDISAVYWIYKGPKASDELTPSEAKAELLEILESMPKNRTMDGPLKAIFLEGDELKAKSFDPFEKAEGHFIHYDVGYYD